MGFLAQLKSDWSGRTADLTATGYTVLREGTHLGRVVENPMYSQTMDAQGLRVTGMQRSAREQQIRVMVTGSSPAQLQSRIDLLMRVCDDITRRGGGVLSYRSANGTQVTRYRVVAAQTSEPAPIADYEAFNRVVLTLALVADVFGMSTPLDVVDTFSTDTFGTGGSFNVGGSDWSYLPTIPAVPTTVSNGVLTVTGNVTGEQWFIHDIGTRYTDVCVSAKFTTGATVTSIVAGVFLSYIDANNYTRVYADASTLYAQIVIGGVVVQSNTTSHGGLSANTAYWVRGIRQGAQLFAQIWASQPTPMGSSIAQTGVTLTSSSATSLPSGRNGIAWSPRHLNATVDDFTVQAFWYRNFGYALPYVARLEGQIGGTMDALAAITYTSQASTPPRAMMFSWWPRPAAHNLVWNGGGEVVGASPTTAYGWQATAVTNITGAATSVSRGTTAGRMRSGSAYIEAVTPATANTGVTFPLARRGVFRMASTWTAQVWLRAASGTTTVRIRLGAPTDVVSSTPIALSTTWTLHTVTWSPLSIVDIAYLAVEVTAATATTFQIDDAAVFEGVVAPSSAALGGYGPGFVPAWGGTQAFGGTGFSVTSSASYLTGFGMETSGSTGATSYLDVPILPQLFEADDYTQSEVDIAVFARVRAASTQTGLTAVLSVMPDLGTTYGGRRYGSASTKGRAITLPSSGTAARHVYLGSVNLKIDRNTPRRDWLRVLFTNSPSATGTIGLDYLVIVPKNRVARSRSGTSEASVPNFISSSSETSKTVLSDLSSLTAKPNQPPSPDDGLSGTNRIALSPDGSNELLVWPSSVLIDRTDVDSVDAVLTHDGAVQVSVQPRTHLLSQ